MSEFEIRGIVAVARCLLDEFDSCRTGDDYDRLSSVLVDVCTDARKKIQAITGASTHEAANIFLSITTDDDKLENFIAQAFIAQRPVANYA